MMKKHLMLVHLSLMQILFLLHYKLRELNEPIVVWPDFFMTASAFTVNLQSGNYLPDIYELAAISMALPLIAAITIISLVALATFTNTALPNQVSPFTTIFVVLTVNYLIPWKSSRLDLSGNRPYQFKDQAEAYLSSKFPPHSP